MNKNDLDYVVECHVLCWESDNNYNVNLFGYYCDEKEYIMKNFYEKIGRNS